MTLSMPSHDPSPAPRSTTDYDSPTSPPHRRSILRRLSISVPKYSTHVLERLLSPKTVHSSIHKAESPTAQRTVSDSPLEKKVRRFSFGVRKERHVTIEEREVVTGKEEEGVKKREGAEFGVPLCREAEIEKWRIGVKEGRRRRMSWH
jgi:hypothetical protein